MPGDRLVQPDLANTLEAIAKDGPRAFYQGPIAQKLAAAVQAAGGVMTVDDLKDYRAIERPPIRGTYRGYDIVSMAPPSSGGIALIEMLNILEGYDLAHEAEAQTLFLMIEAMKRAYADRAWFLGDPDMVQDAGRAPDLEELRRRMARHHRPRARHAARSISMPAARSRAEGRNYTHFSIVNQFGNAMSNTYYAQLQLWRRAGRRRHRHHARRRSRRFRRQPNIPNA